MTTLVEGKHPGGFLVWEAFRDYTRETITVAAGTLEPGTVLGKITASGKYAAHDPAAIRAQAIGHARAVVDLCRLAGHPQMAGRFLEEDASLDEVRAALLAAKAEAEPEIAPHHSQPGRSSAARPWGEIVARTFKLKG